MQNQNFRHDDREFAVYKGEESIAEGTMTEIAEQLGVSVMTVKFYNTRAYERRIEKRERLAMKKGRYTKSITMVCLDD